MVSIVVLLADAKGTTVTGTFLRLRPVVFELRLPVHSGIFLRVITEEAVVYLQMDAPHGGVLVLLLLAWVVNGWLAKRMWIQHKAAGEAEGWKYDRRHYIGNIPSDEDNFFMALPFNVYAPQGFVPMNASFWDELPEPESIDFPDPPQGYYRGYALLHRIPAGMTAGMSMMQPPGMSSIQPCARVA